LLSLLHVMGITRLHPTGATTAGDLTTHTISALDTTRDGDTVAGDTTALLDTIGPIEATGTEVGGAVADDIRPGVQDLNGFTSNGGKRISCYEVLLPLPPPTAHLVLNDFLPE
jgi:hypothetical protein